MVSCWMCLIARASKLAAAGAAAPSKPYSAVQAKRIAAYTVLRLCAASQTNTACTKGLCELHMRIERQYARDALFDVLHDSSGWAA